MNNISFGARFTGMNKPTLEKSFSKYTNNDKSHIILYAGVDKVTGKDVFELYNNGVRTAKYTTEIWDKSIFSIERLVGIFNILKKSELE